jgi:hypothetical protein
MELLNTTSNTLSTIPLTIINPGGGAVAPVLNAIPDETVTINIDPGPRDLTAFLTAGQPAPTWSLTAGYDTATGQLCPGRILSVSGNVSGICTVPGTYAVTAKALNASGNATRSFNEVVQADTTPDPFSFTDIFNVGVGTSQVTNPCVTISGANYTMTTTISAGTWTKNGGAPSGAGGTAVNGDVICLQGTASGSTGTAVNAVFCAGGVCDTWTIITNPDVDPTPISFTPHSNVLPSSTVTSNCQDIAGISAGSTVSILLSSGKWTKNCSAAQPTYTTASAGTATLGDSIGLQHTASASHSSPTVQTLTYGNRTATFVSVTDSGTAPTCSAIDPVSGNVGNVFLMDLNNHSTGVLQFTASPLPGGITASGGILSGIFNAITSPTLTTNVIGSNNYGSCTTSIAFTVQNLQAHCDDIPLQTKHINDAVNIDLNLWCTNAISYTATPLPAGLTFISPKIVGTVTTVGPVTTTIQAANTANTFSGTLSWNILTPEGTDQTIGSTPGDTNGATGDKGHTVPSEKH